MSPRTPANVILSAALLLVAALPVPARAEGRADAQIKPAPAAGTATPDPSCEALERALFEAVNKERAARGLPAVSLSPALTALARRQSEDMAERRLLDHASAEGVPYSERLEAAGILYASNGENVARSDSPDPGPIHEILMKSGGHRDNILRPGFDTLGVGARRGTDGIYYVTQDFIRAVVVLDEAEVRAAVQAALDEVRRGEGLPPLPAVAEIERQAQVFARLKAEGRTPPPVPENFGETRVEFYSGPDLDEIIAAIKGHSLERFRLSGVGAHFARGPEFPGGAYYVCTFLVVGNEALLWSDAERIEAVLRTLNEVRSGLKRDPLALDPGLNRAAGELGSRYEKREPVDGLPAAAAIAVLYETSTLGRLAPDLHARVAARGYRRVGISVRQIASGGGLDVNFLVVLLLEN